MSDPWAEARGTIVVSNGQSAKVYHSAPGALYAAFQLSAHMGWRRAKYLEGGWEEFAWVVDKLEAFVWQRCDESEWVVLLAGVSPGAEWWCCTKVQWLDMPDEFRAAMVDAGLIAPVDVRFKATMEKRPRLLDAFAIVEPAA